MIRVSCRHDNLASSRASGGVGFDYDSTPQGPPKLRGDGTNVGDRAEPELLMFALPHHQVDDAI